jgi:hypothetical protein
MHFYISYKGVILAGPFTEEDVHNKKQYFDRICYNLEIVSSTKKISKLKKPIEKIWMVQ